MLSWFIKIFGSKEIDDEYEQEDFLKLLRDEKALTWAFGENPPDLMQHMLIRWDQIHRDIFPINPTDSIYKTMSKIYYQYKKANPDA